MLVIIGNMASLKKTISTFEIEFDYSKAKALPVGGFIESPSFTVGGYNWALRFYAKEKDDVSGKVTNGVYLTLLSEASNVFVDFHLYVLDMYSNVMARNEHSSTTFESKGSRRGNTIQWNYLDRGVCFSVRCSIAVSSERKREEDFTVGLNAQIKELLKSEEISDVTFEVEGKMFPAHRVILAARSRVFKAELFGPMVEGEAKKVVIKDMRADVFGALLHFIYTDEVSDSGLNVEDVLVAADRYAIEKLKALCEGRLSNGLSIKTVIPRLIFADRYSCASLKEKCLQFASKMENFGKLAFTREYFGMGSYPDLVSELGERFAKRQKSA